MLPGAIPPTKPVRISTVRAEPWQKSHTNPKKGLRENQDRAGGACWSRRHHHHHHGAGQQFPPRQQARFPIRKESVMSPPDVVPRANVASRRRARGGSAARAGHWRRRRRGHTTRAGEPRDKMGGLLAAVVGSNRCGRIRSEGGQKDRSFWFTNRRRGRTRRRRATNWEERERERRELIPLSIFSC